MVDPEQTWNTRNVFRDTLALFVGQGRRFSVEAVSAATGIGCDAIRAYLRGQSCPEWANAIAILNVMPAEFANAVLQPAGLSGARKVDATSTAAETLREITEGAAALASALADGRIDHTEWPTVRKELIEAQVSISQLLSRGEG